MLEKKNGITLIVLIITIIVILILAGVTINMVLGENGLFNKAKASVQMYEKRELEEELQHIKAEAMMDAIKNNKELTVEDYVKLLEDKGMVADKTAMANKNDDCDIVTNSGYRVNVSKSESGELIIVVGEKDLEIFNKKVEIENIELKAIGATKIEVKVKINGAVGVSYTYTCNGASNSPMTTDKKAVEFAGLSASTQYTVKVVATNQKGTDEKDSDPITTGAVVAAKDNVDFTTVRKENGKKEVTITAKAEVQNEVTGCTIKWKKDGETEYRDLTNGKTTELDYNDKIYAVFVNAYGEYDEENKEEYIVPDTKAPTITQVKINTANSISAGGTVSITIKAEDDESGIDYTKAYCNQSKYLFHKDKIIANENETTYTGALSSAITGENMTPTISVGGTYYLHVMIKDVEGNISYGVSEETIKVNQSVTIDYTNWRTYIEGLTASSSGNVFVGGGGDVSKIFDQSGEIAQTWVSKSEMDYINGEYIIIQLKNKGIIEELSIQNPDCSGGWPEEFKLQGSNDGVNFVDIQTFSNRDTWPRNWTNHVVNIANRNVEYIYYKILITKSTPFGDWKFTGIAETIIKILI